MPFKSKAQAGYLHSHPEILGKSGLAEWDAATRGKHLPEHVKKYHDGVDSVPHDTLALLQKGEAVIPKKDNHMAADWREGVTGSKAKPKKEISEIRTRKSHDGKFIHTHVHHHPEHHPNEEHVSTGMSDLHDHFEDHAGVPNEGEAPANPAAAPMTAAPSPMAEAAPGAGAGASPAGM